MHPQAYNAVGQMVAAAEEHGLELERLLFCMDVGGQDVNGTAREHFGKAPRWASYDRYDETADYIGDARIGTHALLGSTGEPAMTPFTSCDVVLCTEVLEHVRWWPLVVRTCFEMLKPGGFLFITAAAPPRAPHSAQGLTEKPPLEWYENVNPDELRALVDEVFKPEIVQHTWREDPGDVYLWAKK